MTVYNCRHDGDQYRMTKFDGDLNVERSYLLTLSECECPAGSRESCRHRQMLSKFLARGAVGMAQVYDFDRDSWEELCEVPDDVVPAEPEFDFRRGM